MMAPCGGFKMASNRSTANIPRLLTLKHPPVYSCGLSFPSLARPASSRTAPPISESPIFDASRTTGVTSSGRRRHRDGHAHARRRGSARPAASSHVARTFGDDSSARETA